MNRPPYRAVILDLDRTLLRSDKTVSERTLGVLKAWRDAGAVLYAATARPARTIGVYRRMIGLRSVTTLNGALTLTPEGAIERPIPADTALRILEDLVRIDGAVISAEAAGGLYASREIPEWQPAVMEDIRRVPALGTVFKILVSHPVLPPDRLPAAVPEGVYTTVADRKLLQFMSSAATKWNGILDMLRVDCIAPGEAICFGDDHDDIEPLRRCGCGVAVANALSCVKEAADDVAASNDEDGVAEYLAALLRV